MVRADGGAELGVPVWPARIALLVAGVILGLGAALGLALCRFMKYEGDHDPPSGGR